MSRLSRGEYIELGVSLPTAPLARWAADQLAAARGREGRLERRGIHSPYLEEIETLIGTITDGESTRGCEEAMSPAEVVDARRIREEAFAFWQAAKRIVNVEFGSKTDMLTKFRLGVRTAQMIAGLKRELDCIVSLLGRHSDLLGWLGVTETFQRVGEVLIGKLGEAQAKLDSACRALSPAFAEQCCRKGRLCDMTRTLVRIGQWEFFQEPEQAAAFSDFVPRAGSEVRVRSLSAAVR